MSLCFAWTSSAIAAILLGEYRFEEPLWNGVSGEVKDSSGNNRHGTAIGSPLPSTSTAAVARIGNPGTCGYAQMPGPYSNGGAFRLPGLPVSTVAGAKTSVAFWMYWDGTNSVMPLGWDIHDLWLVNGHFGFNTGNSDVYGISSAGLANGWHHVVAEFTNGNVSANRLFIDGVGQALTQRLSTPNNSRAVVQSTLQVGGWQINGGYRFSGRIDEVRVYNGVLAISDVNSIYLATHPCIGTASPPGGFNAFDTDVPAGSIVGPVRTKVAAQGFALSVVALNSAKTAMENSFVGDVKVELLDASDNSGALGSNGCRASWVTMPASAPATMTFTLADSGRKNLVMAASNAWKDVRVRMSYPATGTPAMVACSTDNFAVRPDRLLLTASDTDWNAAGTTRALANGSATGGAVHKAGRPFTLSLTAQNAVSATATNYDGAPGFSIAVINPAGCQNVADNCILTPGAFSASAGVLISNSASYNEAGVIAVTATDTGYANVDTADTPGDCTAAGRYICSVTTTVGRFVPDRFSAAVNVPQFGTVCGTGGFTYVGQPFGYATTPLATVTALNAAGRPVTHYAWTTPKVTLTDTYVAANPVALNNSSAGGLVLTDNGNGVGTISGNTAGQFAYQRGNPVADFNADISIVYNAQDASENAVSGNGIIGPVSASFGSVAFDMGASMRFGRLKLTNAYGPENRQVVMPYQFQYWNGNAFVQNSDSCSVIPLANITRGNYQGALNAGNTATSVGGACPAGFICVTSGGNRGSVDITVATGSWLRGRWDNIDQGLDGQLYDDNPVARATFGSSRNRLIYSREN